ncbi:LysR substrate-binding domain-containing protein [Actibacterium sp. 188UL27-1]|uniref:LysR substrate-binding domain-containing protein n=1 Tax=Actibacterium sp. 188UL27-1 TaxID=2786961 RepID=UPI00195EF585|nr:hypothetical protein [Actibacterium sp. 188UL27-1]
MAQARWSAGQGARAVIRISDLETAHHAVCAGLDKVLLPTAMARTNPRLVQYDMPDGSPSPTRPIWLLRHVDQAGDPAVEAVIDWLDPLSFC